MLIDMTDWIEYYTCGDGNTCWSILHDVYCKVLNQLAPMKRLRKVKSSESWTSSSLFKLIRERDRLKAEAESEVAIDLKKREVRIIFKKA